MIVRLAVISVPLVVALAAPSAHAAEPAAAASLASRTYVSSKGADSNACLLTAPCRSFSRAVAQTASGGEVVVLDSASYGSVTITKSISIVNDGLGTATAIAPANGAAITVKTAGLGPVYLRGLEIDGQKASNASGINLVGGRLIVTHCTITRYTKGGIEMDTDGVNLTVLDSKLSGAAGPGTAINVQSGNNFVAVDRSAMTDNKYGLAVLGGSTTAISRVSIKNSTFVNNSTAGVSSSRGLLTISDSLFTGNGVGIQNQGGGEMSVGRSAIRHNGTGFVCNSSPIASYGDNELDFNGEDLIGNLTSKSTQ